MPLKRYACSNCGFWQRYFAPPPDCPVCTDTRNDLPEDGWWFLSVPDVRAMLQGHWREVGRDMIAFSTSPQLGLNGSCWLLLHPDGNTAFEAAPFYTDAMLAETGASAAFRYLAASHAHGYGALWQLQDAFQPEPLEFDTVCTPFEYAPGITRDIALAVLEDGMHGPPGVPHIRLSELRARAGEGTTP